MSDILYTAEEHVATSDGSLIGRLILEDDDSEVEKVKLLKVLEALGPDDGVSVILSLFPRSRKLYGIDLSKLVSECALCLIENEDALPGGKEYGGILTSASGLGNPLISRLSKVGINFEGPL